MNPNTKQQYPQSQQERTLPDEASVTLSFGGVNFCLSPSEMMGNNHEKSLDGTSLFSISRSGKGMKIQLNNFSGTLLVSSAKDVHIMSTQQDVQTPPSTDSNDFSANTNHNNTVQEEEDEKLLREKSQMSQPQRSATPSPPKPDRDRDLKEMVNSMPVLPVPTFNPYLTIPDRATPKVSFALHSNCIQLFVIHY